MGHGQDRGLVAELKGNNISRCMMLQLKQGREQVNRPGPDNCRGQAGCKS